MLSILDKLRKNCACEIYDDLIKRSLYATDASAYRQMPLGVVYPASGEDVKKIIEFAKENNVPLIPRGTGTSLAGQVVGDGLVVDFSKKMTKILEISEKERWARVQPGVVLSQLNKELKNYGLFFGPETSTANRVTLGGMVGNNACGLHSVVYGSTRDHLISVTGFLSSGKKVVFEQLSAEQFAGKLQLPDSEGDIYRTFNQILSDKSNVEHILETFPPKSLKRRNTGYALDFLADTEIFNHSAQKFNVAKLIAGSEGTLFFATEIKLNLVPLPPKEKALLCVHFQELKQAFYANLIALEYKPSAVELMDKTILDLTKDNPKQRENRFFIKGDPQAVLIIELNADTKDEINKVAQQIENQMRKKGYGYHFPLIWADDTKKVWDLRRSGLGVLSNVPTDARPVSLVEDTAVDVRVLPDYVDDFDKIMQKYGLSCVYHAHIGSGELHLRPMLNLKKSTDVGLFRKVAKDVALLVKKYRGSLSGEHGDGRLRGEFIPLLYGDKIYGFFKQIKKAFDPQNIFNPGKIVDTPPMNTSLRYEPDRIEPQFDTIFDFSKQGGYLRAAEKCNGSADCRKLPDAGGVMCPSYQATRNEWNSTRARANILREFLTYGYEANKFAHKEIYEILDTCLSCKACKKECPSGVDMTKLKAEFLQHYYDANGVPTRTLLIAYLPKINKILALMPKTANFLMHSAVAKFVMKKLGFAEQRDFPQVNKTLHFWYKKSHRQGGGRIVYLFNDEFTDINDPDVGIKAVLLLERLGYQVVIPKHLESGRTYLSKGLVRKAKRIINKNLLLLKDKITGQIPLIGLEPSAILTFRDEALDLADQQNKPIAKRIAKNTMLFEEFFVREVEAGRISASEFTDKPLKIRLHGHCYQKALASTEPTIKMLSLPINYEVEEIPSGCCGMAGAFGYEKEHYELSMKIGEMVLFPTVRQTPADWEIAAPGTSCRHHIDHATGRKPKHPVEIMFEALK